MCFLIRHTSREENSYDCCAALPEVPFSRHEDWREEACRPSNSPASRRLFRDDEDSGCDASPSATVPARGHVAARSCRRRRGRELAGHPNKPEPRRPAAPTGEGARGPRRERLRAEGCWAQLHSHRPPPPIERVCTHRARPRLAIARGPSGQAHTSDAGGGGDATARRRGGADCCCEPHV